MEAFSETASAVLRTAVGALETPVVVCLLLIAAYTVACVGALIAEWVTEHRHFAVFLPKLVDELKANPGEPADTIKRSGLLLRQKRYLVELTLHPSLTATMRESLAVGIEHEERRRYDGLVRRTDLIARVAPMLGLLGTLIPLGPGIVALGQGDLQALSSSLLTAFDTTAMGLVVAGVALLVSSVRKRWYRDYMVAFDAMVECVLEVERERWGEDGHREAGASSDPSSWASSEAGGFR